MKVKESVHDTKLYHPVFRNPLVFFPNYEGTFPIFRGRLSLQK